MLDKNDLQAISNLLQPIREDMDTLKSTVSELESSVTGLQSTVTWIQLHLENVTDKNIRIIAENHLDLSRKLDDVLKFKTQNNLFEIRLNCVESDTQEIKNRLTQLHTTA